MRLAPAAMISAGALFGLIQQTPAPVDAIVTAVFAGIAGGEIGQVFKHIPKRDASLVNTPEPRDADPFAGLSQPAANECKNQLHGATVKFSPKDDHGVRIDGVPPACMTLANVFLGQNPGQPAPIPMGMFATQDVSTIKVSLTWNVSFRFRQP